MFDDDDHCDCHDDDFTDGLILGSLMSDSGGRRERGPVSWWSIWWSVFVLVLSCFAVWWWWTAYEAASAGERHGQHDHEHARQNAGHE